VQYPQRHLGAVVGQPEEDVHAVGAPVPLTVSVVEGVPLVETHVPPLHVWPEPHGGLQPLVSSVHKQTPWFSHDVWSVLSEQTSPSTQVSHWQVPAA